MLLVAEITDVTESMIEKITSEYPPGYGALRRGRRNEPGRCYMVTTVTAGRVPVFKDLFAGRMVVREMMRLQEEGSVESLAWVVMPDHLHWLLVLAENSALSKVVQQLKGRSAHGVNHYLGRGGSLWQKAFHDHAVRKDEDVRKLARYIVANPLRAGLVKRVDEYPLWDAVWL